MTGRVILAQSVQMQRCNPDFSYAGATRRQMRLCSRSHYTVTAGRRFSQGWDGVSNDSVLYHP